MFYDGVIETINCNQQIDKFLFYTSHGPNLQNQQKLQF